jgi:hypothetical protein
LTIVGISGNVGEGKNTFAVAWARVAKEKYGREVYANFHLFEGLGHYITMKDFIDMRPNNHEKKLVIIDEGYASGFDSRRSSSDMNLMIGEKILQSRKYNMTVMLIAQLYSTLDLRFRRLAQVRVFAYHANQFRFKYAIFDRRGTIHFRYLPRSLCEKGIFPYFDSMEIVEEEGD